MLKKVLDIVWKVAVGILLFYIILGFIIIPLVLTWGISSQGTKILKTPVHVRSVFFNPFLLDLTVNRFEILDVHKKVMIGFQKLKVDVSFLNLLKKVYRIESVKLEGLQVNTQLLTNGHINLLELVPINSTADVKTSEAVTNTQTKTVGSDGKVSTSSQESSSSGILPEAYIDSIVLKQGSIRFVDQSVNPNFATTLGNINIEIINISTKPDCKVKLLFEAKLDDKGNIAAQAMVEPFVKPLQMETNFVLNNYVLDVLTPYVGKYTGRQLKDGKLDVKMVYTIDHNKLKASHKVLIQRFKFGQKVESKDALSLPFGLAVALLEDPQGRINISLPVDGDMSDPKFHYFHLIAKVLRDFFFKIITKPFSILASVIGSDSGTEELGMINFEPGQSNLSQVEKDKLHSLIKGLKERPKLRLEVDGSYDSNVDWKAIKTSVFVKDYDQLKEDSTRKEAWIYERLYERRFGIRKLWDIAKKYRSKDGSEDIEGLNKEIKRQIVEDAPADKVALGVLAESRAKTVYDFLIAAGFDSGRLNIGQPQEVQASMGQVPLEFKLTIFNDDDQKSDKNAKKD